MIPPPSSPASGPKLDLTVVKDRGGVIIPSRNVFIPAVKAVGSLVLRGLTFPFWFEDGGLDKMEKFMFFTMVSLVACVFGIPLGTVLVNSGHLAAGLAVHIAAAWLYVPPAVRLTIHCATPLVEELKEAFDDRFEEYQNKMLPPKE